MVRLSTAIGLLIFLASGLLAGCGPKEEAQIGLDEVAVSDRQWTGVALSKDGRTFVCYPRWSNDVPISVAEILQTGEIVPYPNEEWNQWDAASSPTNRFVCVQSVFVDDQDFLWVLDPANPWFQGVLGDGPKLIKIDLSKNEVVQVIRFADEITPPNCYLNDVRIDTKNGFAYITDSGLGAIIVVNLLSGESRRLLADDPSTKSENIVLTIEGKEWRRPNGEAPSVNSDGIALDHDGKYLYYQALTGRSLYRIETRWLRDDTLSGESLGKKVELVGKPGPADGIMFGIDGNLYLSAIEENAVKRMKPDGRVEPVAKSPLLQWPDSFSRGPDGYMYVTSSQINVDPAERGPYRLFKFRVPGDHR